VIAGAVFALMLIEAGLRAMPDLLPKGTRLALDLFRVRVALDRIQEEDPELGVRLKPNTDVMIEGHPDYRYRIKTHLNLPDRGFRGNVETRPLVGVALGDSFTFGFGVEAEDAWPEQLSRLASKNFANLGGLSYGPPQYTEVLKRYGLPLKPKIVLYALYQNDLRDSDRFARWQQEGGLYRREAGEKGSFWTNRFPAHHSRLYQLVLAPSVNPGYLVADQETLVVAPWRFARRQLKIGWGVARRAILSARHIADEKGATFVLLVMPAKEQTLSTRPDGAAQGDGRVRSRRAQPSRESAL